MISANNYHSEQLLKTLRILIKRGTHFGFNAIKMLKKNFLALLTQVET